MPDIVQKPDGFWAIHNDQAGEKVFFLYQLGQPNRQTLTVLKQQKKRTRVTKMEVCSVPILQWTLGCHMYTYLFVLTFLGNFF